MNDIPFDNTPLSQETLDSLVDGELRGDQRRQLLVAIDSTPGAWRACAMAFLEAQAWRQELGGLAGEVAAAPQATRPAKQPSGVKSVVWGAVAAAVLLAFGLGTLRPIGWGQPIDDDAVAAALPDANADRPAEFPAEPVVASDDALTFFVSNVNGERQEFAAPLVDAAEFDERFGMTFPSRVTPAVIQALEGRGFRVSTRRRYAPLYFEGGRPLMVPVEDVQLARAESVSL